jgi:ABC-type Co2+ transport system permease subunit
MTPYWSKPKTYGYGATPSNWQGWAATGVFVIVVMALSLLLLGLEPKPGTGLGALRIGIWALMVAGLTVGFVWLSCVKTDGQWAWRWGK